MATLKRYKGAKAKSDTLFSQLIRSVGYCESCFRQPPSVQLQCAHIVSRRYNLTRTDFRNAFSLCAGCHRHYTDFPRQFSHFITTTWAQAYYEQVEKKAKQGGKFNWDDEYDRLKEIKQRLQDGATLQDIRESEE